jgi:hypothetical protein
VPAEALVFDLNISEGVRVYMDFASGGPPAFLAEAIEAAPFLCDRRLISFDIGWLAEHRNERVWSALLDVHDCLI